MSTTNLDIRPKHYLNLDATTIKTECFALAQRAVADCVARDAMGALYGPAGNGKTFAVRNALAAVTDRDVICVDCQVGMTYKGLVELLLESVTGGIRHEGTRGRLERDLIRELRTRPRIVCIDEAQRLTAEGIEILRSLHDDDSVQLTLLLVGGNNCWTVLSSQPMLRSRIHRPVEFRPLTESRVLKLIPRMHPLVAKCAPDVLKLVDRSFARGNLRNWANFVVTAEDICTAANETSVTEAVVRNAFTLLNTRPSATTS
jgi:type II secretory pathway predicted ATPase ExeA